MGHKGPSHESSFMIKDRKKKKSMALFIKNLEHVQLIGVPWGKICDSHKTCAISPYDKTSHNQ